MENWIVLKKYFNDNDYKQIGELEKLCIANDKVNLKLELEYKLHTHNDNESGVNDINEFLYYIDNELVGYIGIGSFGGNVGEINGMVHPAWRRRGIFKKLIELTLEECKRRNFSKTLLLSDDKSVSGVEFIKAAGASYSFSEYRMRLKEKKVGAHNQVITLTKARNSHGEEIRRQNSTFFGGVDAGLILPEKDEENGYTTYIVELDCTAIGKIKVERENKSAFISGFGIVPEYRSKGFGKAALQRTIEMLWNEGILDISLDVASENSKALNLYKSCGFVEESTMNYYEI